MLINCNLLNLKGMVPPHPRHRVKKIIVLYNDFFYGLRMQCIPLQHKGSFLGIGANRDYSFFTSSDLIRI